MQKGTQTLEEVNRQDSNSLSKGGKTEEVLTGVWEEPQETGGQG